MNRSRAAPRWAAALALAAAAAGGCANPWADHYHAASTPSTAAGVCAVRGGPVVLLAKPAVIVGMADPPAGMVELGRSRFEADADAGSLGLRRLAESVGAREVWWAVEPAGTSTTASTTHMPVHDHARTTGSVTAPDGSTREVDLTTTTTRWEDVTVTSTRTRYWHVARLFGPPQPVVNPPGPP